MAAPVVKHRGRGTVLEPGAVATATRGKATQGQAVVLASSDPCPRCGNKGHLISDHVEEQVRQCTKCACVAQDTENA